MTATLTLLAVVAVPEWAVAVALVGATALACVLYLVADRLRYWMGVARDEMADVRRLTAIRRDEHAGHVALLRQFDAARAERDEVCSLTGITLPLDFAQRLGWQSMRHMSQQVADEKRADDDDTDGFHRLPSRP